MWCPGWPEEDAGRTEARAFGQVVTAVEDFCPEVEVLRPGCASSAPGGRPDISAARTRSHGRSPKPLPPTASAVTPGSPTASSPRASRPAPLARQLVARRARRRGPAGWDAAVSRPLAGARPRRPGPGRPARPAGHQDAGGFRRPSGPGRGEPVRRRGDGRTAGGPGAGTPAAGHRHAAGRSFRRARVRPAGARRARGVRGERASPSRCWPGSRPAACPASGSGSR